VGAAPPSVAPAQAAVDASSPAPTAPAQRADEPAPTTPAGLAASSGAAGVSGPAPFGGAFFALSLAAMSLAAALSFARLLQPPAHWRPVFLVSLIERPG
jgi:hypothetical protein